MLKRFIPLTLLIQTSLLGNISPENECKILYSIHKGDLKRAFSLYLEEAKDQHDFSVLQKAALTLLEEGMDQKDVQIQLLSVIGAGVALNKIALSILKEGIRHEKGEIQMAALNFLGRYEEDDAIELIQEALSSPYLIIRLEAALLLAEKQENVVVDHLYSFYGKIPPQARVLFPQILTLIDTPSSTKFLKQLLSETDDKMRIATVIHAALAERDDLLPNIRSLATHTGYAEQEAAAFALGKLKDSESKEILTKLIERNNSEVRLAALNALFELGDNQSLSFMLEEVKNKNLYAIGLMTHIEEGEKVIPLLEPLLSSDDFDLRINVALPLLKLKERSALSVIKEIVLSDKKDLGFMLHHSPGKALSYWTSVPSFSQKIEKDPRLLEQTMQFKSKVLTKALELPEDDFLEIARALFDHEQKSPLIPLLVELLSNHNSEKTLALLKEKQKMAGSPFIRSYATLALYQLTQEKMYEDALLQFIKLEKDNEMIVSLSKEKESNSKTSSPHHLSREETSSFLMGAFEALASSSNKEVINALIEAMAYGNPKNRYALAGLLIRMTE